MYTHTYYTHHTRTIAIDLLTIRKLKKWFSDTIKDENVARNVKKIKKIKAYGTFNYFCKRKFMMQYTKLKAKNDNKFIQ